MTAAFLKITAYSYLAGLHNTARRGKYEISGHCEERSDVAIRSLLQDSHGWQASLGMT